MQMLTSPDELLTFAKGLASGPDSASFRASVSRAYYAAFHAANILVWGMAPNAGLTGDCGTLRHGEVGRRLRELSTLHPSRKIQFAFGAEARSAADKLIFCRHLRGKADYNISTNCFTKLDVRDALARAERVIQFCKRVQAATP